MRFLTLIEMVGTVGVMELTDSPPGFELYPNSADPFSPTNKKHLISESYTHIGGIEEDRASQVISEKNK